MNLDLILTDLGEKGGSDLHLKVDRPPLFRLAGDLQPAPYPDVTREEMQESLYAIMPPNVVRKFEETLEADFSYEVPGLARFRVNCFVQRNDIGAVFRLIPIVVPTIDSLGLPQVFKKLGEHNDGLVIVAGPTGSGKSTTLATIIEHINQTHPNHIVTIEDPIEFVYTDQVATINQRELNIDTLDLLTALRAVLRQDPDVILMGEMRDRETMDFALKAAETGHLVFSTLHTTDAKQTLDRIFDTFPPDQTKLIRQQLALHLRAVICQRLVKRADGTGRIPTIEIMINSPTVSKLIMDGDMHQIEKAIETDTYYGMQTFNQAFQKLVESGIITEETAMENSSNPEDLKLALRGIRRGSAQEVFQDDISVGENAPAAGKSGRMSPPDSPKRSSDSPKRSISPPPSSKGDAASSKKGHAQGMGRGFDF
jgi:twitching motility protein PilT